jgi:hypothetical protein
MAFIKRCYYSSVRPFRDRPDIEIKGRWHWCPPGAKTIPYFHAFGAFVNDPSTVEMDPVIGEVAKWNGSSSGSSSPRYTGQNWCGSEDVWTNGALYSALGTPAVDDEGIPLCCVSAPPTPGGACADGEALWEFIGGGGLGSGQVLTADEIGGGGLGSGQVLTADEIGGGGLASGQLVVALDAIGGGGLAGGSDGAGCVGVLGAPSEFDVPDTIYATVIDLAGVSGVAGSYPLTVVDMTREDWVFSGSVGSHTLLIDLSPYVLFDHLWSVDLDLDGSPTDNEETIFCSADPGCWSQTAHTWVFTSTDLGIIGVTICTTDQRGGGGLGGGGVTDMSAIGGGGVAGGGVTEQSAIGGGGVGGGGVLDLSEIGGGGVGGGGVLDLSEIGGGGVASAEVAAMAVTLRSLRFDGATVYVSVPSAAILHPTSAFTLACWIKTTQSTLGRVIAQPKDPGGAQLTGYSILIGYPTAGHVTLYGDAGLNVTLTSPGTINDGAWHHIAATWNGTTARLYVDGTEVSNTAVSGPPTYDSSALVFGRYGTSGQFYAGMMDEVALWVSALSAGDVAGLADGSVSVISLSPDGYWPFEEGGDSLLHDRSGQGNNGTASVVSLWSLDHPPI